MLVDISEDDLSFIGSRLPGIVKDVMFEMPNQVCVAGGFIRSVIAGEPVNDVDLFGRSKEECQWIAGRIRALASDHGLALNEVTTDNAITLVGGTYAIQIIHRWVYNHPLDVIPSFDFTVAMAAVWYVDGSDRLTGKCHHRFYQDLAAKRLVYTSPVRQEEAGGSMVRVLKFLGRGYRIPLESMAAVSARWMQCVDLNRVSLRDEESIARVLAGALREVDPNSIRIDV